MAETVSDDVVTGSLSLSIESATSSQVSNAVKATLAESLGAELVNCVSFALAVTAAAVEGRAGLTWMISYSAALPVDQAVVVVGTASSIGEDRSSFSEALAAQLVGAGVERQALASFALQSFSPATGALVSARRLSSFGDGNSSADNYSEDVSDHEDNASNFSRAAPWPSHMGATRESNDSNLSNASNDSNLSNATLFPELEVEIVQISMRVANLNYNTLAARSELRAAFSRTVALAIAATVGVPASLVSVQLSPGSIVIVATISLPSGPGSPVVVPSAQQVSELLVDAAASGELVATLAAKIAQVPGISEIANGPVTVDSVNVDNVVVGNSTSTNDTA
ncbi:unnamed protein product, partial [Polarella glacialis]